MNISRLMIGATLIPGLSLISASTTPVQSQVLTAAPAIPALRTRGERFRPTGVIQSEDEPALRTQQRPTEAPTGFDNLTNGFTDQGPPFDSLDEDNVVPLRSFNDNRFIFEEVEKIGDGLGPTYNAQSCSE